MGLIIQLMGCPILHSFPFPSNHKSFPFSYRTNKNPELETVRKIGNKIQKQKITTAIAHINQKMH